VTIKVWEWEENMWREKKEGIVKTEQKGELYDNDSSLTGGIYATLQCLFFFILFDYTCFEQNVHFALSLSPVFFFLLLLLASHMYICV